MYLSYLGGFLRGPFVFARITRTVLCMSLSTNMNSKAFTLYEEAIYALNGLQSNAVTLQKSRIERGSNPLRNLINTEKHLNTLGIQLSDLDSLKIIHVAGTKGKGSTCAFIESILRKHGFKTGFYSSPHLVSVNERIRVNGSPLDKNLFTRYFWEVYKNLQQNLKGGESMPHYSMFLTVMAFYVFLKEKIEAAVIEVGIGGLYDCTNVIKKPVVVAVTSLGIDHVHILGQTLPEIAAQKAGIFKPGVPAFTVPQPESAMKVLYDTAKEVNCPLRLAPSLHVYDQDINLGIPGIVQNTNASLALQAASTWLKKHSNNDLFEMNNFINGDQNNENILLVPLASSFCIDSKFKEGLESCVWPGRFQTIEKNNVTVYLDGAHTQESMKYCVKWFQDVADRQKQKLQSTVLRVLLFNCTGDRRAENLLDPLSDVNFDLVVFSPNRRSVMKDSSSDQSNFMVDPEKEVQQCITNKEIWCHLMRSLGENELSRATQSNSTVFQHKVKTVMHKEDNTLLFCCLGNAVNWLLHKKNIKHCASCDKSNDMVHLLQSADHVQILVTGSLHLVGGVLAVIE